LSELEHEVFWEPGLIALDLLIQSPSFHTVQLRQISIDDDVLSSDENDSSFDELGWDKICLRHAPPSRVITACDHLLFLFSYALA
jgi:hypothetical protein